MASKSNPIVSTSLGALEGVWNKQGDIASFNGVPFAQAPIGDLRWKPPQPVQPWNGTRQAKKCGSFAWQRRVEMYQILFTIVRGQGWGWFKTNFLTTLLKILPAPKQSEDCLFLNIKTPDPSPTAKLPVMVWFHGGDHTDGSGSEEYYMGEALSQNGVVYVSINYRLGLMGYFAHPDLNAESEHNVSGNYGTLDQIESLKWVKEHIANFGGDPDNVTIFGESAGGESVAHMMTSPLAQGLFHKAIMQSPANSGQMTHLRHQFSTYISSEQQGLNFAKAAGATGEGQVAQLRKMSAKELQALCSSRKEEGCFFPTIDGHVIPESPFSAFRRNAQSAVPLLLGFNKDEGTILHHIPAPVPEHRHQDLSGTRVLELLKEEFQDDLPRVLELYPGVDKRVYETEQELLGHVMFGSKARFYAEKAAESGPAPYFYMFTWTPHSDKQTLGACHAAELVFVHGTETPIVPLNEKDKDLSRSMSAYWAQFAKTGNPNKDGQATWEAFDAANPRWLELGYEQIEMKDMNLEENFAILNRRMLRQLDLIEGFTSTPDAS